MANHIANALSGSDDQPFIEYMHVKNEHVETRKIYFPVRRFVALCLAASTIVHNYADSTYNIMQLIKSLLFG